MSIVSDVEAVTGIEQAKISVKAVLDAIMVIGIVGFALWVWRLNHLRAEHLQQVQTLSSWQADVRQTTSTAAHVEKDHKPALLALDQVQPQIVYLGQANDQLNTKVAEQNKTIDAMKTSGDARVDAGNAGLAKVSKDRAGADKAATDLRASAAGNTAKTTCVGSVTYLKHSGEL